MNVYVLIRLTRCFKGLKQYTTVCLSSNFFRERNNYLFACNVSNLAQNMIIFEQKVSQLISLLAYVRDDIRRLRAHL